VIFYGWVIVGAGMVISCIGLGAMLSLGVFLQPMAEATGWSRTGISTAALLNWLSMGVASFLWGTLSDRYGTRLVVLGGGTLLGLGMVTLVHAQSQPGRGAGVGGDRDQLDDHRAARAVDDHGVRLAHGDAGPG
jgi:predicted MFS family arabinose efflux permease